MKRTGGGASRGYKMTSELITSYGVKPKKAKIKKVKKGRKPNYKVPATPKVSGQGWK